MESWASSGPSSVTGAIKCVATVDATNNFRQQIGASPCYQFDSVGSIFYAQLLYMKRFFFSYLKSFLFSLQFNILSFLFNFPLSSVFFFVFFVKSFILFFLVHFFLNFRFLGEEREVIHLFYSNFLLFT